MGPQSSHGAENAILGGMIFEADLMALVPRGTPMGIQSRFGDSRSVWGFSKSIWGCKEGFFLDTPPRTPAREREEGRRNISQFPGGSCFVSFLFLFCCSRKALRARRARRARMGDLGPEGPIEFADSLVESPSVANSSSPMTPSAVDRRRRI